MRATSRAPRRPPPRRGWEVSGDRRAGQRRPGQCRHPELRSAQAPRRSSTWSSRSPRSAPASPPPTRRRSRWSPGAAASAAASSPPTARGGPMAVPIVEMMVDGPRRQGRGARPHLSHRRSLPEPRDRHGRDPRQAPGHQGDQERSAHPRLLRGRRAIRHRLARRSIPPAAARSPSGAAGTIPRSAPSRRSARRAATTSRSTASTATPRRWRTSRRAS